MKKVLLTVLKKDKKNYERFIKFVTVNNLHYSYTRQYWHFVYNITSVPKCCTCENDCAYKNFKTGYRSHCGVKCANSDKNVINKIKRVNLERYGVENPMQLEEIRTKVKKTCIEKYGVENPMQLKDVRLKAERTNLERYGVKNVYQSEHIKNKIKNTLLLKYHVTHPSKSKKIIKLKSDNYFKKRGVKHQFMDDKVRVKINNTKLLNDSNNKAVLKRYKTNKLKWEKHWKNVLDVIDCNYDTKFITFKCDKCGSINTLHSFFIHQRHFKYDFTSCVKCHPLYAARSSEEIKVFEYIKSIVADTRLVYSDRKTIFPLELDIYIPSLNIAIEYNGLFYHSEKRKTKDYHQNKFLACFNKNIQLITIWADDWKNKQLLVKNMLAYKLNVTNFKRVYARCCIIKEIDSTTYKNFTNTNHLNGHAAAKIKIGLYYNKILIMSMSFSKSRVIFNDKNNYYELVRFCVLQKYSVIGGASKLLKYAQQKYNMHNVLTYQDLHLGFSDFYAKLGFEFKKFTVPNYCYIINNERRHRCNFTKHKLLEKGYVGKNEHSIMYNLKYYRIYGAGNALWIY